MRKLYFIDNDKRERADSDLNNYIKFYLNNYLNPEYVSTIEIISDFYSKDKEEMYNLCFSKDNAIITWSVYTTSLVANSYLQLFRFLKTAGISEIKNAIYIDVSGEIVNALDSLKHHDINGLLDILLAIKNNYIITRDSNKFKRIKLNFDYEEVFTLEEIDLSLLLDNSNENN